MGNPIDIKALILLTPYMLSNIEIHVPYPCFSAHLQRDLKLYFSYEECSISQISGVWPLKSMR